MNMQKSHLARKTTALLSAIATSSLLGLPALAGTPAGMNNTGVNQAQAPSSVDQSQCMPSTQSNQSSTTATPDASAPAAAQLPNQSDPRAGTSPSGQTISPADQVSGTRVDDQAARASITRPGDTSDASRQANSYGSDRSYGGADRSYANVLAQGGATTGGFAIQQVYAANNPDDYRTVSSRINSNEERPNFYSSGMSGNMGSTMSSSDSMRSSMSTQPDTQSYNQSSRTTSSARIAQCPDGMVAPQSTTPSMRQAPGQSDLNTQPSSSQQRMSPSQPTGNETRPSPADDNGGRTR